MTSKDAVTVARNVAQSGLRISIDKNIHGVLRLNMCGYSWEFPEKPVAETMESFLSVWQSVNSAMWAIVREEFEAWVAKNKQDMN